MGCLELLTAKVPNLLTEFSKQRKFFNSFAWNKDELIEYRVFALSTSLRLSPREEKYEIFKKAIASAEAREHLALRAKPGIVEALVATLKVPGEDFHTEESKRHLASLFPAAKLLFDRLSLSSRDDWDRLLVPHSVARYLTYLLGLNFSESSKEKVRALANKILNDHKLYEVEGLALFELAGVMGRENEFFKRDFCLRI